MSEYQQKDGEGVLFKNKRATKETHPQYTGSITVKGVKYSLAAWLKESKDGTKRLSLSVKPWEDNSVRAPSQTIPPLTGSYPEDPNDSIPF